MKAKNLKYIKGKDRLPRKKKKAMKKRMLLKEGDWNDKSFFNSNHRAA